MTQDYKVDRDRYIAFSLAAADLLIEVDADFRILKAVGATQALLSRIAQDLKGQAVFGFFAPADRPFARRRLEKAKSIGRIEPCSLHLIDQTGKPLLVSLGACCLPLLNNHIFLSLTVLADVVRVSADQTDPQTGLLNKNGFQAMALRALKSGDDLKGAMRLVRLSGLSGAVRELNEDKRAELLGEVSAVLRSHARDAAAARLDDDAFGFLVAPGHEGPSAETLDREFASATSGVGVRLTPQVLNLELSVGDLDEDSVTRALSYALSNFCKGDGRPGGAQTASLGDSLKAAMRDSVEHLDTIRGLLNDRRFTLHYQPVVDLKTRQIQHYEALMRFPDGRSPYETIRLSEQLGVVQEFDLAACALALEALVQHPDTRIAVNLSGLSVQSADFREKLRQTLVPHAGIQSRLLFELTESNAIDDMEAASVFLRWLRRTGFSVALDDFGSGASAYAYLRHFEVDYLKIDGPFLRDAQNDKRQRALVRSVCGLCAELGTGVIGEMIETEDMAALSASLGVTHGQGYLFGRPLPQLPAPPQAQNVRRRGEVESWG